MNTEAVMEKCYCSEQLIANYLVFKWWDLFPEIQFR